MSFIYNSDIKNIIKNYFNYIIKYKPIYLSSQLLDFFELIIHNQDLNIEYQIKFIFYSLSTLLKLSVNRQIWFFNYIMSL